MIQGGRSLATYLGSHIEDLLSVPPFSEWMVVRSIEEFQQETEAEIWYEFDGHGVEVVCDETERIRTIFLHRGDGEALFEMAFSSRRQNIVAQYGCPSKSGAAARIPGLGDHGAWDRFSLPTGSLHVQYRPGGDDIEMITLMRSDAVP